MYRTFHPVGQGAFATEMFEETGTNIVFDCGSEKNRRLISQEIKSAFDKGEEIAAVFISHLDEDHVNGLEFILNHCRIKHVFLPLLTEMQKIELYAHNAVFGDNPPFIARLISNPAEAISGEQGETQVHLVEPTPPEINPEMLNQAEPLLLDKMPPGQMASGRKISAGSMLNWIFLPFNFQSKDRAALFRELLDRNNIKADTIDDFIEAWKSRRDLIAELYRLVPGSMNTNSMTVYSGPDALSPADWRISRFDCYEWFGDGVRYPYLPDYYVYFDPSRVGCLYFGDYEAQGRRKWEQLDMCYHSYWNLTGCVEIPHHGSRHNYNPAINQLGPMLSVMCSGENNQYRHPHHSTVKSIVEHDGLPILVTERVGSRFMYVIRS